MNCKSNNPAVQTLEYSAWLMGEAGNALQKLSPAEFENLSLQYSTIQDLLGMAVALQRYARSLPQ